MPWAARWQATGASMVVVEHRVQTWLPLVDRVIVLTPAGVIADGDPDRGAARPRSRARRRGHLGAGSSAGAAEASPAAAEVVETAAGL